MMLLKTWICFWSLKFLHILHLFPNYFILFFLLLIPKLLFIFYLVLVVTLIMFTWDVTIWRKTYWWLWFKKFNVTVGMNYARKKKKPNEKSTNLGLEIVCHHLPHSYLLCLCQLALTMLHLHHLHLRLKLDHLYVILMHVDYPRYLHPHHPHRWFMHVDHPRYLHPHLPHPRL